MLGKVFTSGLRRLKGLHPLPVEVPGTRPKFKKECTMIVEIRAAEGGDDAKLLVADQLKIYARLSQRRGL